MRAEVAVQQVGANFLTYLKYKAQERGKHFVEAGKYFPSTQLCFSCGHKQKMGLHIRKFKCGSCHLVIDSDYNSSISIKTAGMSVLNACGATWIARSCEARILRL